MITDTNAVIILLKRFPGFEWDSKSTAFCATHRCNALPTELSLSHTRVVMCGLALHVDVILKYMNSMVLDVQQ